MRILRIAAVVIFLVCLALNILGTARFKAQQDVHAPQIQSTTDHLELTVSQGQEALMQGLTAQDVEDGDLTDKILLASTSYFTEKGSFNASYVVFDKGHNAGSYQRKITYTDYTSPRFALTQPLVFSRGDNVRFLNFVTATDCLEGDITGKIKVVESAISNYTAGVYPVVLEVSNSYGDRVQVQLSVVIQDRYNVPQITLESYIVYIRQGESFDPMTMIRSVRAYGTGEAIPTDAVSVLGVVDTGVPGCYQLCYTCEQSGQEGRAYLTVVVEE